MTKTTLLTLKLSKMTNNIITPSIRTLSIRILGINDTQY
jgi:hypothetical protein